MPNAKFLRLCVIELDTRPGAALAPQPFRAVGVGLTTAPLSFSLCFADYMIKPNLKSLEVPHSSLDQDVGLACGDLNGFFSVGVGKVVIHINSFLLEFLLGSLPLP